MGRRTGLLAFCNSGGLGIQTKRLYDMLKPEKVMIIDSRRFSQNKEMNWDWYPEDSMVTDGFPRNCDINKWLVGLDSVLTVENPYNFYLVHACKEMGIKLFVQTNYEFCENVFAPHLPVPDMFLMPSYWKLEEMKKMFPGRVMYLPPPIDPKEFEEVFEINGTMLGQTRFLHIVGTLAAGDRNGTLDLLKAVKLSKEDYSLTIHSQHELPKEYLSDDPRIEYRIVNFDNNADLYMNFDALILPRRYGGLSLTTNEALMSGMPVMMTDISPNNELLPWEWLVPATKKEQIQARMLVDCYSADAQSMANKIDDWTRTPPSYGKARGIGVDNFSADVLEPKYASVIY